jgi:hypothetical protein
MPLRSAGFRLGAFVILALGWWWLSAAHPQLIAAVRDRFLNRPSRFDASAAIAAAVTLTLFIAACLWASLSPCRSRGPDAAMGEGCAIITAIGLAALGVLLAIGWFFHVPLIIWFVAAITVLPGIHIGIALIYEGIKALRKKRAQRGRRISGQELTDALAGRTHVIRRISPDQPPRRWRELRFYAPDGQMRGYAEEEDGHIHAHAAKVTWRVENGQLVIDSSTEPQKPFRYTMRVGVDGELIYLHFEPGAPLHGYVLFRTMEILAAEPVPRDAPGPLPAAT